MKHSLCLLAIISTMLLTSAGLAATVAGIGNAEVNKGQTTLTLRESFGSDSDNKAIDNRWRQRLMADYGFTDWYAAGIYLQSDRRNHNNIELESVIWENRVEIHDVKHDGFYSGFRIRYTYRDGDKKPDNLHLRTIIGAPVDNWEFRFNPIFYTDLGPDSRAGLGIDMRAQVTYGYSENHRIGMESFHDIGNLRYQSGYYDQSHTLGFIFTGKLHPGWGYETGYAKGITTVAPDHSVKLFITRSL